MDTDARQQIRLLLEHLTVKSRTAVDDRVDQIYAQHSARGMLRSGGMIKVALRAMEESGDDLLKSSIDSVASVARDMEAFAMLHSNLENHIRYLELKLDNVLKVSGATKNGVATSGASREAKLRFGHIRSNITRQLEIHRFTFTEPFRSPVSSGAQAAANDPPAMRNPGGKPLAKHWDAMWAAIAVQLYAGDLKPETQADIERAMKDWFAENDLDIGDTAVRARARTLWHKLQSED